jgi:multidrug transporter EmrE-like cation transporter
VAGVLSAIPAILIAQYTTSGSKYLLWTSIVLYVALIYAYVQVFRRSTVGVMYTMIKVISSMIVVILAILLFRERLNWIQWLGLAFAVVAIILLSVKP